MLRLSGTGTSRSLIGLASWNLPGPIIRASFTYAVAGYQSRIADHRVRAAAVVGLANAVGDARGTGLGAGHPDRADTAPCGRWYSTKVCLGAWAPFVGVRRADPPRERVQRDPPRWPPSPSCACDDQLRLSCSNSYGMVITQSFNVRGANTWTPTWITWGGFWLWEIPLSRPLSLRAGLGPRVVALADHVSRFSTVRS